MLTDRELQILKLRKEGKTQAEIAKILKISQPAVSSFERNAQKKIKDAEDLLEYLKKAGLLVLALLFLPLLAHQAAAATPNPGHDASRIGPGTFTGNFTFNGSVNFTGSSTIIYSPQICLNGDCRTSWPGSSAVNVSTTFGNSSASDANVSGTYNNLTIAINADSLNLNCANITGATSNLCTITDTNSGGTVTGTGAANYSTRWSTSTAAAQGSFYDNGSYVGIGNTAPNASVHIASTAPFGLIVENKTGGSNGLILAFNASSGALGIGTSAPTANLHIADSGSAIIKLQDTGDSAGLANINFYGGNTLRALIAARNDATSGSTLQFAAGGQTIMSFNNTSLGFGTTTPTKQVTISDGTAAWLRLEETSGTADIGRIDFATGSATYGALVGRNDTTTGSSIIIEAGSAETARYTSSAIGFFTKAPRSSVDINGTFRVQNTTNHQLFSVNTTSSQVRVGDYNANVSFIVNGSINSTGTITQYSGFDVAEMFGATEAMSAGDLVAIVDANHVKKATETESYLTIGAVSTQPGFVMAKPDAVNPVLIGLSGRIPVKVQGQVLRGDFITVSDTPGVGKAATEPGYVIGRALEDANNGLVTIIIQPSYFSPQLDANAELIGGKEGRKLERGVQEGVVAQAPVLDVPVEQEGKDVVITIG